MKPILVFIILLFLYNMTGAQTCQQRLGEATQLYYNGQLREVTQVLEPCIDSGEMDKPDKMDALKLLVNTHLLLKQDSIADVYMERFLILNPNYELSDNDLAEFRKLYHEYILETKYRIGFSGGIVVPDYVILYHHSVSGDSEQPHDYEEKTGFSLGITGDLILYRNLYLNGSFLFSSKGFKDAEEQYGYRTIRAKITEYYLDFPVQLRYFFRLKKIRPFIGAGMGLGYLVSAKGDIDHWPSSGLLPAYYGSTYSATKYDLSQQRKKFSCFWLVGAGIQTDLKLMSLEIRVNYQRGISNLINESARYDDPVLVDEYSYVPDDYKVNSWNISVNLTRNFIKPRKR